MTISDEYPEGHWLKMRVLSGQDSGIFKEGVVVDKDIKVCFEVGERVSASRLLAYDFFFGDGPNLISPRLHKLMIRENISGVQFVDADLVLNGESHAGYKILNVIDRSPAFNLKESVSEPLLSYMPDGPRWFSKVILDDNTYLSSDIVRAKEESATIVATARVKSVFESNSICGVQFAV
ncbi:hypothetical protein [Pseudomonas putida]|uniref:hypothetical protein n=1 Tax=Pseudomonas putida TaxID=303 RepID=UPI001EDA8C0B|nr:hypothetical protein [Pseudomonas putida]